MRLRPKQDHLENQIRLLKAKLLEYENQQPLIQILRTEFQKAQRVIKEVTKDGALVNSCKFVSYFK